MPTVEDPIRVKVVIVGAPKSGKTALLEKYLNDRVLPEYIPTKNINFYCRNIVDEQKRPVRILYWEIAGNNKKLTFDLAKAHFGMADVVLAVIDLSDKSQLQLIEEFQTTLRSVSSYNAHLILVGMKCFGSKDVVITSSDLRQKAKAWQCEFVSLNLGDKKKIDQLFLNVEEILLRKLKERLTLVNEEFEVLSESGEEFVSPSPRIEETPLIPILKEQPKPIEKLVPPKAEEKPNTSKPNSSHKILKTILAAAVASIFLLSMISACSAWPVLIALCVKLLPVTEEIATILVPSVLSLLGIVTGGASYLSVAALSSPSVKREPKVNGGMKTIIQRIGSGETLSPKNTPADRLTKDNPSIEQPKTNPIPEVTKEKAAVTARMC